MARVALITIRWGTMAWVWMDDMVFPFGVACGYSSHHLGRSKVEAEAGAVGLVAWAGCMPRLCRGRRASMEQAV